MSRNQLDWPWLWRLFRRQPEPVRPSAAQRRRVLVHTYGELSGREKFYWECIRREQYRESGNLRREKQ